MRKVLRGFNPKKAMKKLNPVVFICRHLIDERYSVIHRKATGVVIMGIGVGVTKIVFFHEIGMVHAVYDLVGYGIHGLGAVPFIETFIKNLKGK